MNAKQNQQKKPTDLNLAERHAQIHMLADSCVTAATAD